MKFEEAIDYLKSMIPMKKEEFNKLSAHLKYRAFTIAKVSSEDLINKVKQIYTKALEEGKTKAESLQEVHKILPNLTANHLSTHYNNNVMIAYNAGRIRHFKESSAVQYLMYNAILDGHTTNLCRKLHGTVKPKDDPFWDKFYPPNHHNCYSEDTEVLTLEGWKSFKEVKGNEIFASINPDTHEIEYVPACRKIAYPYKGKMIHLKAPNFDLLVTPDHNMAYISSWKYKYRKKKGKIPKIELREARTLADSDVIPRTGNWKGIEKETIQIGNLEFDTYYFMKFMGWYLSEGSITKKSKNHWQIKISQEKDEYIPEILDTCNSLFKNLFNIHKWTGGIFITGSDKSFYEYLKKLGKSYEKYIPAELKQLSPKYLRALLDTYIKGDGTTYNTQKINSKKGNKWEANFSDYKIYFTSSKKLADDISELILKCGKLPSIKLPSGGEEVKFKNGIYKIKHPVWIIAELNSKNFHIRKRDRNKAKTGQKRNYFEIDYEGYVYCVELEKNHILYVRRNGKCCWSGNCRSVVYPVHKNQLGKKISYIEADEETGKLRRKEIKIKPSKLNPKTILKDKILSQEFQFRGNPEKAIYEIPDSLIDRAIKYGIIEDLIKTAKNYFCKIKLSTEGECEKNIRKIFVKSKESFEDFIQEVLSLNFKPKGRLKPIGWLSKDLRELIKQKGLNPKTPLIVINDKRIIHSIRDVKAIRGSSLSVKEIKNLPDILENPEAVIFDKIHQNIIYVSSSLEDPKKNKIIVEINYKLKKLKKLIKQEPEFKDILEIYEELENIDSINLIKTLGKVEKRQIIKHINANEYEIIRGKIH